MPVPLPKFNRRLRHPGMVLATPVILIGLAGTAIAVADRSSDTQFISRQQYLSGVQPAALAHLLSTAPNPRPDLHKPRALRTTCRPLGTGEFRNPWTCTVRYARGGAVRYTVSISPDGRMLAVDSTGQLIIRGCCVGSRPVQ
jgi:hypothetical protein